ncbi:MAG: DUF362 domain-containing protein, partial [Dehalococcoidia bacterium]|nr:DUF362 domain-containing protein [Dehalococcoidia bacterium]
MTQKSRVAVLFTSPQTVLSDYAKLLHLIGYQQYLPPSVPVLLKINISWQHYYPACSTAPWQLDGVIQTLKQDGYKDLIPAHNGTVVVDAHLGSVNNRHSHVLAKHGRSPVHLEDPPVR